MPWGENGYGGAAGEVCGMGREREGTDERSVSGVWRFTADGLSLAATLPASRQCDGDGGTQPSSGTQSQQTERRKEERVVALRQEHGWGAGEAGSFTARRRPTAHGDNHQPDFEAARFGEEEAIRTLRRCNGFERAQPNELWQMDGKGAYGGSDGMCYPLSILDDHSRYVVGLYGLRAFTAEEIYPVWCARSSGYGVLEAMLMDRGSGGGGRKNGYGLTWLSVRMIEQAWIGLHYGRVHHPQTQGKVERFHRTLTKRCVITGSRGGWRSGPERWKNFGGSTTSTGTSRSVGDEKTDGTLVE